MSKTPNIIGKEEKVEITIEIARSLGLVKPNPFYGWAGVEDIPFGAIYDDKKRAIIMNKSDLS